MLLVDGVLPLIVNWRKFLRFPISTWLDMVVVLLWRIQRPFRRLCCATDSGSIWTESTFSLHCKGEWCFVFANWVVEEIFFSPNGADSQPKLSLISKRWGNKWISIITIRRHDSLISIDEINGKVTRVVHLCKDLISSSTVTFKRQSTCNILWMRSTRLAQNQMWGVRWKLNHTLRFNQRKEKRAKLIHQSIKNSQNK